MTVRLAQDVGMGTVAHYAERFGVYDDMDELLANALGSQETTLYDMVAAYAMFANGGERVEPTLVDRIQDRDGRDVYSHDKRVCTDCETFAPLPEGQAPRIVSNRDRVMDAITAYQLTSMLPRRGRAGHGVQDRQPARAHRRQDRHDERRKGRLVHRFLLDHCGGLLHRLRPAALAGLWRVGRWHVRPGLRRLHGGGSRQVRRRRFRGPAGRPLREHRPIHRCAPARRRARRRTSWPSISATARTRSPASAAAW